MIKNGCKSDYLLAGASAPGEDSAPLFSPLSEPLPDPFPEPLPAPLVEAGGAWEDLEEVDDVLDGGGAVGSSSLSVVSSSLGAESEASVASGAWLAGLDPLPLPAVRFRK